MKITFDEDRMKTIIESEDGGGRVELGTLEASELYTAIQKEIIRQEVLFKIPDIEDECLDAYGCSRATMIKCAREIANDLFYEVEFINQDLIDKYIDRWVDHNVE